MTLISVELVVLNEQKFVEFCKPDAAITVEQLRDRLADQLAMMLMMHFGLSSRRKNVVTVDCPDNLLAEFRKKTLGIIVDNTVEVREVTS